MQMLLRLYNLETDNGTVEEYPILFDVESEEEAEENEAYYQMAMNYAAEDLGCEVHSFEYYEWEETENA